MSETTANMIRATLYKKIAAVAAEVRRVEKDGYNPQLKYHYAKPDTIMAALKPLLATHGIVILPTCLDIEKHDTGGKTSSGALKVTTRVHMVYTIACTTSGEAVSLDWYGEGEDWSDKGIAKAKTIALRTFLIQLFQIPTGDEDLDPDRGEQQTTQKASGKTVNRAKTLPTRGDLIMALEALWSREEELGAQAPQGERDIDACSMEGLIALGGYLKKRVQTLAQGDKDEYDKLWYEAGKRTAAPRPRITSDNDLPF